MVVKSEPVLVKIEIHDPPKPTLYHSTVTEDGREVLELFSSDDEMEIANIPEKELDKGMTQSSNTSPGLVLKSEPVLVNIEIHDPPNHSKVTEDGREDLEQFLSNDEMEIDIEMELDKGTSSDTAVGDDFGLEIDSEDDEDPHSFLLDAKMSDYDSDSDLESSSTTWLDEDISSTVKRGPFQVTRQCTVDYIEYLSALPTYWPVPRNKRAYLIDLSDSKYNIKDKNDKLLPVDALIKNSVRISLISSLIFHCGFNQIYF